ncbi:MAG: hypothetical protein KKC43_15795 [Alphaproteobacteria bacterium]|nr:hypothetical protein [Alphaproteobacteria bacterium]
MNGFREKIREAVRRLRDMGHDALADSLEEELADEAAGRDAPGSRRSGALRFA